MTRKMRGILVALAILLTACGAKTGLTVPDLGVDATVDAPTRPCIELLPDGGPIELPLDTEAKLARADVYFLIDTTASMQDEIDQIRGTLRDTIAPAVRAEIPDVEFGVATFADFPVSPYGDPDSGDTPFNLVLPMTADLTVVQGALNSIQLRNGGDKPESQVEALYLTATGEGFGRFVQPSLGCPRGGRGYPCFRDEALPVILLFTDALFHNDSRRLRNYGSITPSPHTYAQARDAITDLGARVIGLESGNGESRDDLITIARDSGALDQNGNPIVLEIGERGERLGPGVVDALRSFAEGVVLDIDAVMVDPDPRDGVNVLDFVDDIEPLRAEPMSGVQSIDRVEDVFRGVLSGTRVIFQLTLQNDSVVQGPTARRFILRVVFRGDERQALGERDVEIVVPGMDGSGCESDNFERR